MSSCLSGVVDSSNTKTEAAAQHWDHRPRHEVWWWRCYRALHSSHLSRSPHSRYTALISVRIINIKQHTPGLVWPFGLRAPWTLRKALWGLSLPCFSGFRSIPVRLLATRLKTTPWFAVVAWWTEVFRLCCSVRFTGRWGLRVWRGRRWNPQLVEWVFWLSWYFSVVYQDSAV